MFVKNCNDFQRFRAPERCSHGASQVMMLLMCGLLISMSLVAGLIRMSILAFGNPFLSARNAGVVVSTSPMLSNRMTRILCIVDGSSGFCVACIGQKMMFPIRSISCTMI